MLLDQVDQTIERFVLGNVELHCSFTDVEVHLAGSSADIAEVGVSHLPGAIDDASHDGDPDSLKVRSGGLDAGRGLLEIEKGATAGGTGDVVGLEDPDASGLKDVVSEAQGLARGFLGAE
jgi:hypothetical protein